MNTIKNYTIRIYSYSHGSIKDFTFIQLKNAKKYIDELINMTNKEIKSSLSVNNDITLDEIQLYNISFNLIEVYEI